EGAEPGVAGPAPEAPAPAEAPGDPTRGGWDGFLDPLRDAEARVTAAQARVERRQVHVGFGLVAQLALSRRPEALLPVEYRHDESDAKVFTSGRIRVHSGQDVVGFPFTYRFP